MRISIALFSAFLAMACSVAHAQGFRWVDKDGKVRYGDVPPPGVKATPMKPPAGAAAPASAPGPGAGGGAGAGAGTGAAGKDAAAKDARKGPLTPVEQEQAYRERQLKTKEAKDKADKALADAEQLKVSCAAAQEGLRSLEMGGRLSSINAKGETVILDDTERSARIAQARKAVADTCK